MRGNRLTAALATALSLSAAFSARAEPKPDPARNAAEKTIVAKLQQELAAEPETRGKVALVNLPDYPGATYLTDAAAKMLDPALSPPRQRRMRREDNKILMREITDVYSHAVKGITDGHLYGGNSCLAFTETGVPYSARLPSPKAAYPLEIMEAFRQKADAAGTGGGLRRAISRCLDDITLDEGYNEKTWQAFIRTHESAHDAFASLLRIRDGEEGMAGKLETLARGQDLMTLIWREEAFDTGAVLRRIAAALEKGPAGFRAALQGRTLADIEEIAKGYAQETAGIEYPDRNEDALAKTSEGIKRALDYAAANLQPGITPQAPAGLSPQGAAMLIRFEPAVEVATNYGPATALKLAVAELRRADPATFAAGLALLEKENAPVALPVRKQARRNLKK